MKTISKFRNENGKLVEVMADYNARPQCRFAVAIGGRITRYFETKAEAEEKAEVLGCDAC